MLLRRKLLSWTAAVPSFKKAIPRLSEKTVSLTTTVPVCVFRRPMLLGPCASATVLFLTRRFPSFDMQIEKIQETPTLWRVSVPVFRRPLL